MHDDMSFGDCLFKMTYEGKDGSTLEIDNPEAERYIAIGLGIGLVAVGVCWGISKIRKKEDDVKNDIPVQRTLKKFCNDFFG